MKKLLIISLFIISALSFADNNPYDYVEDKLQLKYVELTDGKNKLDIDDIDVGSFNNKIYVNMEVEAFSGDGGWSSGDGGWSKFDKASYDKIATQIADDIRKMTNTSDKIEITLVLEREIGKDMLLHEGEY